MHTGDLWFWYMGVSLVLVMWCHYVQVRLLRHIERQYPEDGKDVREMYPWFIGRRTLWAFIKNQRTSDPELARWGKIARHSGRCFCLWFVLALIMFFVELLLIVVK